MEDGGREKGRREEKRGGMEDVMVFEFVFFQPPHQEFRNTWHTLEGILHLPRTSKTVLRNNSLVRILPATWKSLEAF